MKIIFGLPLLISTFAFAGVNGGGTGPRPDMGFIKASPEDISSGGSSGGGVGPRPSMNFLSNGVSGGGTGPRPGMRFVTASPEYAFQGGSGSGVGPRPGMGVFTSVPSVDFVKSIDFDRSGNVQFQFKGFEKPQVEVHAVNIQDVSEKYLEALKRSQESRQWEPVQIEGLEN